MGDSQDSERATIPGVSRVYRVAHSYLGSLWIALDERGGRPGKPVLLRQLQLPDQTPVEALQRIACAGRDAMALNHDNVLSVVGVFSQEESLAVAYAYVQAEPLRSLQSSATLRGLQFPVDVSLRIILDLLRGVKALHGALHGWPSAPPFGGISPDSVLLSPDGRTRLCDPLVSSCAALLEGYGFSDSKLAYAAPEQVHATTPLGAASDVFTCAALLWELLTGRRLLSGSRVVIERKLLEHALPKLRDNLRDGSGVSGALIDVIERSLSADASRRPQTPAALAVELEQCGHEPATPAQVARFVGDVCGSFFERRTAAIRNKFSPELHAELEACFESPPVVGGRKGSRSRASLPALAIPTAAANLGMPASSARAATISNPKAPMPDAAVSVEAAAPPVPATQVAAAAASVPARNATTRRIPLPTRASNTLAAARTPFSSVNTAARREPPAASMTQRPSTLESRPRTEPSTNAASPPAQGNVSLALDPPFPASSAVSLAPEPPLASPAPLLAAEPAMSPPEAPAARQLEPETRIVPEDEGAPNPVDSEPTQPLDSGWEWPEPVAPEPVAPEPVAHAPFAPAPAAAPPIAAAPRAAPAGPAPIAPRPGPKRAGAALGGRTIAGLGALDLNAASPAPVAAATPESLDTLGAAEQAVAAAPPDWVASVELEQASPPVPIAEIASEPPPAPFHRSHPAAADAIDFDVVNDDVDLEQPTRVEIPVQRAEKLVPRVSSAAASRNMSAWSHAPKPLGKPRGRAVIVAALATLALGIAVAVALFLRSTPKDSLLGAAPAPAATRDSSPTLPPAREPAAPIQPPAEPAQETGAASAPTPPLADAGAEKAASNAPDAAAPNAALEKAALESAAPELSAVELRDEQLARLFALESRAELPSCAKRLGASARRHNGSDPTKSQSQLKAARRELMRGDNEKAMLLLCSATAHSAANTAAWQLMAELSMHLGDAAHAKQAIERALKRNPADPTLLGILGDAHAMLGNLSRSRDLWAKSAKVAGSGSERTRRLAALFGAIGDRKLKARSHGGALAYYRRAVVLSAGSHGPSAAMSETLRLLSQPRAASVWSERVARAFPQKPRARVAAGTP